MCNIHYIKNWCLFQCSYAYCYVSEIFSNDNIEELEMHFGNWMNINCNNISRLASNVVNIFSNDNYYNEHNLNDVYNSEIYTEFKNISNMNNYNDLELKIDTVDENYVNIELNNKNDKIEVNDDDYVLIDKDNLD